MYWNHRVIRTRNDSPHATELDEEFIYGIHEVYYECEEEYNPEAEAQNPLDAMWSNPINITGTEGIEGLKWQLEAMLRALEKPILEERDGKLWKVEVETRTDK